MQTQIKRKEYYCHKCNEKVSEKVANFSWERYGEILCMSHQKKDQPEKQDKQQGIEETARLRRELDLFMHSSRLAVDLHIAGKITKEEIAKVTANFINLSREDLKAVK